MTTPPTHPYAGRTEIPPAIIEVYLGDKAGNSPGEDDLVEFLQLIEISQFAGGEEIDIAQFEYDLAFTGERLQDVETQVGWNRVVEVCAYGDTGSELGDVLFSGETVVYGIDINPETERAAVTAALPHYLFGTPITGQKVLNPETGETVDYDIDIEFNPLVDGQILNNMSSEKDADLDYSLWIDPESVRNAQAEDYQQATAKEWTLEEALGTLQFAFNGDEEFVKNFQSIGAEIFEDAPELKNVRIKRGVFLPEALDALLLPLGYNWYVKPVIEDDLTISRSIVVFKRGSGPEKQVYRQRVGEDLDLSLSEVTEKDLEWNILDSVNIVEGDGSLEASELTIEIWRTWPAEHDSLSADDLDKTDPDSEYYADADRRNVHRLWTAGEDGGLIGTREEIPDKPPDLSEIFTDYVPKRRRLFPCLTYADSAKEKRRPVAIEWWNPKNPAEDDDDKWEDVPPEWGATVLTEQMGILFSGRVPPPELVEAGSQARIRVTGTIQGDRRLVAVSNKPEYSPNSRDVKLFLDVSDRFHCRSRVAVGEFKSRFAESSFDADEVDDLDKLQEYVDTLVEVETAASLKAELPLFGLVFDIEVGDIVTAVDGLNISLNRLASSSGNKRYLQVTGKILNPQEQRTTLIVEAEDA